eukprot:TRINITY_DN48594_c0_g1_i1.p1 TRINITY_DN48594_c0_g1~~TRINITY_DN48594_c0_g1_i1.p1  ORF type:complete len:613 (-),score=75.63 TRINITY_DN48594_c0_g1_i1:45-1883(-)
MEMFVTSGACLTPIRNGCGHACGGSNDQQWTRASGPCFTDQQSAVRDDGGAAGATRSNAFCRGELEHVLIGLVDLIEAQRSLRDEGEARWATLEERGRSLQTHCLLLQKAIDSVGGTLPVDAAVKATGRVENNTAWWEECDAYSRAPNKRDVSVETLRLIVEKQNIGQDSRWANHDESDFLGRDLVKRESTPTEASYDEVMLSVKGLLHATREPAHERDTSLPWWISFVRSTTFDLIVGFLICLNTLVMSLQLEFSVQTLDRKIQGICTMQNPCISDWDMVWDISEHCFCFCFGAELLLRIAADGWRYLTALGSFCDAVVVIASSLDAWVLSPLGSTVGSNVNVLRMVRLIKLAKVMRVVRVMKAFTTLRVLVAAVASSVGALAWSMTLLFVLEVIAAIFLSQLLQLTIESNVHLDDHHRLFLSENFGTWSRSMLSVFEMTMAPGGFIKYRILADVHPALMMFVVVYVCVVTFAVVRVITAIFLKTTLSASEKDAPRMAEEQSLARLNYIARLSGEVTGCITETTLDLVLLEPHTCQLLQALGIEVQEARGLFKAIDHGQGGVRFHEYLTELVRMGGLVKCKDTLLLVNGMGNVLARLGKMEDRIGITASSW